MTPSRTWKADRNEKDIPPIETTNFSSLKVTTETSSTSNVGASS